MSPSRRGKRGIIYVMVNPCIAGLVKIGRTSSDSRERARELSRATGVPMAFKVVYDEIVSDAVAAEYLLHQQFAEHRVNPQREFFRIGEYEAIKAVKAMAERFADIAPEDPEERDVLPALDRVMRRWLRKDLVAVTFLQFSDLCALKVVTQPDPLLPTAVERIFDLRVFGEYGGNEYGDDLTYTPKRPIDENVKLLVEKLDPYSMAMTGMPLLDHGVEDSLVALHDRGMKVPLRPTWQVVDRVYDAWGSPDEFEATISKIDA